MERKTDNQSLVAYCGLYCGACNMYIKGKCPGCHLNEKASWCKLRICCMDQHYQSCADCQEFADPNRCKKFNNFMSKVFAFLFKSNRKACINLIKEKGYDEYSKYMDAEQKMTVKR